jgi:hypothetical protein
MERPARRAAGGAIIGWWPDPGLTRLGRRAEAEPLRAIGDRGVRRADVLQVPRSGLVQDCFPDIKIASKLPLWLKNAPKKAYNQLNLRLYGLTFWLRKLLNDVEFLGNHLVLGSVTRLSKKFVKGKAHFGCLCSKLSPEFPAYLLTAGVQPGFRDGLRAHQILEAQAIKHCFVQAQKFLCREGI